MAVQALPLRPRRRTVTITPYLFLAPALVSITILTLLPIGFSIVVAFTNYNLRTMGGPAHPGLLGSAHFVGLQNFYDLLAPDGVFSQVFFPVFTWTVTFALVTSLLNYGVGLLLAITLNNPRLPERSIYRTLLIVPWALPPAISILIWQGLLNQSNGIVNGLLQDVGLPAVPWLTDPGVARVSALLVNLWLGFPFMMIVCLGGLQSIGADVFEAAAIDGASALQRFRSITLLLVFRVTLPLLVSSFSFNMMNFEIIYLLTQGGPPRVDTQFAGSTDVLASFIYNLTLTFFRYDKAAALGIIIFIITAILSVIGLKMSGAFKEIEA